MIFIFCNWEFVNHEWNCCCWIEIQYSKSQIKVSRLCVFLLKIAKLLWSVAEFRKSFNLLEKWFLYFEIENLSITNEIAVVVLRYNILKVRSRSQDRVSSCWKLQNCCGQLQSLKNHHTHQKMHFCLFKSFWQCRARDTKLTATLGYLM